MATCKLKKSVAFSLLGFVVFILAFFIVYWLVICPTIWKKYYGYDVQLEGLTAWAYIWVYSYWFVAVSLLIVYILVALFFCTTDDDVEIIDVSKLKPRRAGDERRESPETYIPFTSYLQSIQPTRDKGQDNQFVNLGFNAGEIDLVNSIVQPPISSLPGSNQAQEDWEDIVTWQSTPKKASSKREPLPSNEPEWEDEVPWPTNHRERNETLTSDPEAEELPAVKELEAFSNFLHLVSGEESSVLADDNEVAQSNANNSTTEK